MIWGRKKGENGREQKYNVKRLLSCNAQRAVHAQGANG